MNRFYACAAACLLFCVTCGFAQDLDQSRPKAEPIWLQDELAVVVVPVNQASLAAYSIERSMWTSIEVPKELKGAVIPVMHRGLAAAKIGNVIYAYSAKTASWGKITLSDSNAIFEFHGRTVNVRDGDSLYVFGINSQAWSGIDLVTGKVLLIGHKAGEQDGAPERR